MQVCVCVCVCVCVFVCILSSSPFIFVAIACQEALHVYQEKHAGSPVPSSNSKVFINIKVCTMMALQFNFAN